MAAPTRIRFSDQAVDGHASEYIIPLNPSQLQLNESSNHAIMETLDGGSVKQSKSFDARPITMTWTKIPSDWPGLSTMLSTIKGYINSNKYVNFKTIDYRVDPSSLWVWVRVSDVQVDVARGGKLKYTIIITLLPEEI